MRIFGLLGYPLDHSWSAAYFTKKFALENNTQDAYRLFPIPSLIFFNEILEKTDNLCGLNITIPYKVSILPFLTWVDETALAIGSVNTITVSVMKDKIITKGYNTDILGFEKAIQPYLLPHHKNALVLGTGGASRSVVYVLKKKGLKCTLVSRKKGEGKITYKDLVSVGLKDFSLVVNTTPSGQYPNPGNPLENMDVKQISGKHLFFDLIYNPPETELLKAAGTAGAVCVNGLEMLKYQAEESWKIWNEAK